VNDGESSIISRLGCHLPFTPGYAPTLAGEEQQASLFVLRLAHALHASG
jgi:hypothetical protein